MNPMLLIDGYKLDHRRQYPAGTRAVYSNWTPRGSRVEGQNEVVFFGLQYFLMEYLMKTMQTDFFNQPKDHVISEYQEFIDSYVGPNDIGTDHIAALHDLGYVPLEFRALPEGTVCPLRVPMLTVENTHADFFWLVNYFETLMSNILWMPCTSATTAFRYRQIMDAACDITGGNREFVQWQGHDFSMRGMPGTEAAMLSGAGHLLSFTGTDTIPAVRFLQQYYGAEGLVGGSVPATEHSVMCAGGDYNEEATFSRLLNLYPSGIVSVVSDTWDLWKVLTEFLPNLKDQIMARDGKLVIRPDSGDPVDIICGKDDVSCTKTERKGVVELLWDIFGGTVNEAGYKELDPHIGVIYGDAITYDRCRDICLRLAEKGFASTNCVFGIGSYTYQYVTRDTYGFAMKATWAEVDGEDRDLYKDPVTDKGEKKSAIGRLAVVPGQDGRLIALDQATPDQEASSVLKTVWRDGEFVRWQNLDAIKEVLHSCKSSV